MASVGDGAMDQRVEVAVSWLTPVKAVPGRDLGGAHRPPLPDGVRRLTDVHRLGGVGHHRIDPLLLGWRRGQGEGDKGAGTILIELEVSGVIKA